MIQTEQTSDSWSLRLYVAGKTPKSVTALANLRKICNDSLRQYQVEIIDLIERPELAKADQIVAIPTLVRTLPPPLKKIIGDLSNKRRVLVALELEPFEA